ncbi:flavodoxin domain-containing protein [Mycoplasma bradburyae]|uniref:Flavodoxin n=1 Tax=Mycoplasma bradburyae TaxID=2963128 RepID=A0AAW6HRR3_9MOLU|nr:flavodoxin domain-containing protein [Mycoplasma bradburyae]MDC4163359.1 flavodoxin domain-containing protein [Mycoplasma bradburyae]MDC4181973.1 flavodoxin domain-containing protein [Mycoplasma bradburyae]MDC4182676.1 flavodoxin domain-containing protein [Mycoplasma bradburyae]MDC4183348.1 flavodoxin domain-containing protein [Mycoplasma bradburyae]MDC4184156.1 flavodoxin domain-containing protein [Mycoplasma bradburyae]
MKKIAIVYGTNLGTTELIAKKINNQIKYPTTLLDVTKTNVDEINQYDVIIFGTSTWGTGDILDVWLDFEFKRLDVTNKIFLLFGCGDSQTYPYTFCDGVGKLFDILNRKKAKIIGMIDKKEYEYNFEESKAYYKNKVVGLLIDQDSQPDKTDWRITNWTSLINEKLS